MEKYSQEELRKKLTPLQYKVTQEAATEPAFQNQYNDCFKEGTYHCIVCDRPLFGSGNKYDSHCGWPAFNGELQSAQIVKISNSKPGMTKVELRCQECNSHLGHLFQRNTQKEVRYCINSASLKFSS